MWLGEFPCPPACALATLSAGLCSGFLHHGYTSRNVRRVRACTRVRGGGQRAVNFFFFLVVVRINLAVGKRKKLTNQSCSETFLRITSANQKEKLIFFFKKKKMVLWNLVVPQCKKSIQRGFRSRSAIKYEKLYYGDPQIRQRVFHR